MKRRRNLLVALLLVCAMGIGVGYAAVTGTLTIDATVENTPINFNVVFTAADKTGAAITSTRTDALLAACNTGFTADAVTVNPTFGGLKEAGDTVTITYTVTNKGDVDVVLESLDFETEMAAGMEDYFEVTFGDLSGTLAPTATKTVAVTVRLKQASTDAKTANFVLTANVKPVNDEVTP